MTPNEPATRVTDADIEAFWRDGVVCLRGVISKDWLDRIAEPIEAWLRSPACLDFTAYATEISRQTGAVLLKDARAETPARGRFYTGTDHWKAASALRAFASHSPLPAIVSQILKTPKVNLYEDSILVKEPGTLEKTAFHQDIAYFHAEGSQICTTWVPLDPVSLETGALKFIRGSHLWKAQYRPNFFVTEYAMPETEGETVPDFHRDSRGREVLSFTTAPGDITIHHARTIHGADGNASTTLRRRALSIRYCGEDARYHARKGVPHKPHHDEMEEGSVMDHEDCPVVWKKR